MLRRLWMLVLLVMAANTLAAQAQHAEAPQIGDINIDGNSRIFHAGDVLRLRMTGTPGGDATFDVSGVHSGIPMHEERGGRYMGELIFPRQMAVRRATIVVHLRGASGVETVRTADQWITMEPRTVTAAPRLYINVTSPASRQRLAGNFILIGTTVPYALVQAQVRVDRSLIPGTAGQRMDFSGQADASGNFSIPVDVGRLQPGGTLTVQAQAFDNAGRSTQWRQFQYATGP